MRPDRAFDVILLSTKAYHLDDVLKDLTPFVSNETYIIPLLNGMQHIRRLTEVFGEERVLGGLCFIESTLDAEGRIYRRVRHIDCCLAHEPANQQLVCRRSQHVLRKRRHRWRTRCISWMTCGKSIFSFRHLRV